MRQQQDIGGPVAVSTDMIESVEEVQVQFVSVVRPRAEFEMTRLNIERKRQNVD